ncbi:MAG: hypothetical protein V3U78_10000 [Thiotrichaceae bacterium]
MIISPTEDKLQDFLQQLVDLAKQVFPTLGRTVIDEHDLLINRHQGKDTNTATSLWWDKIKYDGAQELYYIANIMKSNYDPQYLAMIQQIINDLELVEDDDFQPTEEELN